MSLISTLAMWVPPSLGNKIEIWAFLIQIIITDMVAPGGWDYTILYFLPSLESELIWCMAQFCLFACYLFLNSDWAWNFSQVEELCQKTLHNALNVQCIYWNLWFWATGRWSWKTWKDYGKIKFIFFNDWHHVPFFHVAFQFFHKIKYNLARIYPFAIILVPF